MKNNFAGPYYSIIMPPLVRTGSLLYRSYMDTLCKMHHRSFPPEWQRKAAEIERQLAPKQRTTL